MDDNIHEKYKLLSYQLFGPPTNSLKSYNGPCVNLSKKSSAIRTCNKTENSKFPNISNSLDKNYCLICYANDAQVQLDSMNLQDLINFMEILITPVKLKFSTCENNINTVPAFILQQFTSTTFYLCVTCNAACKNLLQVDRQMKILEQEVKTFKAKFINVVKLSQSIIEKEIDTNFVGSCNEMMDKIRNFIIDGEYTWDVIKEERISDISLDTRESITETSLSNDFNAECNFSEDNSVDLNMASDEDSMKSTENLDTQKLYVGNKFIHLLFFF